MEATPTPLLRDTETPAPEPDGNSEEPSAEGNPEESREGTLDESSENTENTEQPEEGADKEQLRRRIEEAYRLGAGIDEETFNKATEILKEISLAMNSDTFNPSVLAFGMKLLNYEHDIEAARNEGYALGKQEKIAETFGSKRKAARQAADIPHFRGTKGMGYSLSDSIFDIARDA